MERDWVDEAEKINGAIKSYIKVIRTLEFQIIILPTFSGNCGRMY